MLAVLDSCALYIYILGVLALLSVAHVDTHTYMLIKLFMLCKAL